MIKLLCNFFEIVSDGYSTNTKLRDNFNEMKKFLLETRKIQEKFDENMKKTGKL